MIGIWDEHVHLDVLEHEEDVGFFGQIARVSVQLACVTRVMHEAHGFNSLLYLLPWRTPAQRSASNNDHQGVYVNRRGMIYDVKQGSSRCCGRSQQPSGRAPLRSVKKQM